jgi:hypothetical protein
MSEHCGEFRFKEILIGNDGIELDFYVFNNYFSGFELPDYLKRLHN